MDVTLLHTEIYNTPCPECKAISFPVTTENMSNYFWGNVITCAKCGTVLDWWNLLLRHFDWEVPSYLYSIVGGLTTSFMIKMERNKTFLIDLESIGLPADSKVFQISYTANGTGLFPIEVHGNTPFRHFIPKKYALFGMPHGEETTETPVAIQICWIERTLNNEILENLIDSVEAFTLRDYNSCVIPSNVTVEATLNDLLTEYLKNYSSKDRVADFLSNGATYSHQLNILLPLIANYEKFPKFPDHLRGNLNELRSLRNSIAHEGKTFKILDKKTISRLICSSAFGLSYLHLLRDHIKNNKN